MVATATDLVRYQDSVTGADVVLSVAEIKRTICPKATDQEAANFLQLCRYMGLNPFVRDAYLIKYGDQAASMVVGKDAFCKRADAHPQFAGMESGVIVQTGDKEPLHRKGTLVLKEETIVGGWARVARGDRNSSRIGLRRCLSHRRGSRNGRGHHRIDPGDDCRCR